MATCPMCNGNGNLMGILGILAHYRCENCGMDFSHETEPTAGCIQCGCALDDDGMCETCDCGVSIDDI